MDLRLNDAPFHYEMEKLCRLFYPLQPIRVLEDAAPPADPDPLTAAVRVQRAPGGGLLLQARLLAQGQRRSAQAAYAPPPGGGEQDVERQLAVLLYGLLQQATHFSPRWGILTGVRPVKLLRTLCARLGREQGLEAFRTRYLVSAEKCALAAQTMDNEQAVLDRERPDGFSLYIGIPFCPSRCAYCSFVSTSVEKTLPLIPAYVDCLCRELAASGRIARQLGLQLQSVYMGGGTPTTLCAQQMDRVLGTVAEHFDLSACLEYTVEAGRPDTITPEKLKGLRRRGVGRVSINPQTMDDRILRAIGRDHTVRQTVQAFAQARDAGFADINMDLIAGLPGDTPQGFGRTLEQVLALAPESVTVHALALKRASRIWQEARMRADGTAAAQMLDAADSALPAQGYRPYYLYRQSRILGGLENVGFAKAGSESFYNVVIMDESQSILACGAGAGSKLCDPTRKGALQRVFNFKYPQEYVSRFDEILQRKEEGKQLYERFGQVREVPERGGPD